MKKPIKLDCRSNSFDTKGEAEQYYLDKREEVAAAPDGLLTFGQLFLELKEIYEKYCEYTNWPILGEVIGFSMGNTVRENNETWSTTQCFSVHFSNEEQAEFSIRRALTKIANNS